MGTALIDISSDCESYSELDLKKYGAWAYSQHPSTELISWAFAVGDEEPQLWTPGEELPDEFYQPEKYLWHAWHAFFEYAMWVNVLKLAPLPIHNQSCTMGLALALALPRSLGECAQVIGLPGSLQKDKYGKDLIAKLCSPGRGGVRNRDPELYGHMYEYNKQDVVAERAVKNYCRPLDPFERRVWQIDFEINIRGVPLDVPLLRNAAQVYEAAKKPLKDKLTARTGLANPNSGKQFKEWLHAQGHDLPDLTKSTVNEFVSTCQDGELKQTIAWRSALARTPLTKYGKLLTSMGRDGRYYLALKYHLAKTGRWSSTGMNFQNLTTPTMTAEEVEVCVSALKLGSYDLINAMYEDPVEAMSSCLRGVMCAKAGHRLIVVDYKAIEARVIAWLAGQQDLLEVFRTHAKIYEHAATGMFNVPLEEVTKAQRAAAKVAVLACGFQGGHRAILTMARGHGMPLEAIGRDMGYESVEAFAKAIVAKWRKANARIVQLWADADAAAIRAVKEPGTIQRINRLGAFKVVGDFLMLKLPSGRKLSFFKPKVVEGRYGGYQVSYECVDSRTGKWVRKEGYGGDWVQSWTQAVARDIMADSLPRLVEARYKLIMMIHDELIAEMPVGVGSLQEMIDLMCDQPGWSEGLPVAAKGCETIRYQDK